MKEFLDYASDMYYQGKPVMADLEFDILARKYDYKSVGHQVTEGVPHLFQMYSLAKVYDTPPPNCSNDWVITDKLDGAAVSLLFVAGKLVLALTRGDGKLGRDITDKLSHLVPNEIPAVGTFQITGEVVCPLSVPNARNVASGSLNLKSIEEFKQRPVTFFAYDIQTTAIKPETYVGTLSTLQSWGFNTVAGQGLSSVYPTDGLVYRLNDNARYDSLGFTAQHPRGAFALKERKEGVITKLLDVVWQVGKSGVVSPVAILEPVKIGDALVSRATLHNILYINSLNLEIGCNVEVIRSGEIIPRIVRRVD